jgi:hypothetical protein
MPGVIPVSFEDLSYVLALERNPELRGLEKLTSLDRWCPKLVTLLPVTSAT